MEDIVLCQDGDKQDFKNGLLGAVSLHPVTADMHGVQEPFARQYPVLHICEGGFPGVYKKKKLFAEGLETRMSCAGSRMGEVMILPWWFVDRLCRSSFHPHALLTLHYSWWDSTVAKPLRSQPVVYLKGVWASDLEYGCGSHLLGVEDERNDYNLIRICYERRRSQIKPFVEELLRSIPTAFGEAPQEITITLDERDVRRAAGFVVQQWNDIPPAVNLAEVVRKKIGRISESPRPQLTVVKNDNN